MESLAIRYRPRRFDDLVGQKLVRVILQQMVATNAVHPALLFSGSPGTGKTTTLRILAAALNCEGSPVPCGQCVSCKSVFNGTSMDLREIDAASNGLVDDIRDLRQQVLYSTGGTWQVVGLDEAHGISRAGADALLKTIEEPPPNTVFVLLTTEPGKILDTVVSRCMPFTFRRIGIADMVGRLTHICEQEGIPADQALLTLIAERADGGMRDAIMTLDKVSRVGIHTVEAYCELEGESDYAPTLLHTIVTGDTAAIFAGLDEQMIRTGDPATVANTLVATLRDILILHAGGQLPKQGDALTTRHALAAHIDPAHAFASLKVLWDLKTKVRAIDDPRAALDLAVFMLIELFTKNTTPASAADPGRRLTFAEMASLR